jgi:hypothetical protein
MLLAAVFPAMIKALSKEFTALWIITFDSEKVAP